MRGRKCSLLLLLLLLLQLPFRPPRGDTDDEAHVTFCDRSIRFELLQKHTYLFCCTLHAALGLTGFLRPSIYSAAVAMSPSHAATPSSANRKGDALIFPENATRNKPTFPLRQGCPITAFSPDFTLLPPDCLIYTSTQNTHILSCPGTVPVEKESKAKI